MKKQGIYLCGAVILCCGVMAVVDGFLQPPYAVKSAVKVILFFLTPLLFGRLTGNSPFTCVKPDRQALLFGVSLAAISIAVILGGYTLLSTWLDLSAIPGALAAGGGITKDNFLIVSLYIALCNSFLEEFFFRGFAFLELRKYVSPAAAWCFSAAAFSLYHASILKGWFSPLLGLLTLSALFICGLFFNWLNHRRGRIWTSWLMHMGANLAINAIGMKLLTG